MSTSIKQREDYHYQHFYEQTDQTAKGDTEEHGKELRGTSEGLKLWSLKALVKVTRWLYGEVNSVKKHNY